MAFEQTTEGIRDRMRTRVGPPLEHTIGKPAVRFSASQDPIELPPRGALDLLVPSARSPTEHRHDTREL